MPSQVMTVTGPLPPSDLGTTDAHSHLWIEPVVGSAPDAPQLHDEAAIVRELEDFRRAGGRSVVDCQPGSCGRNGAALAALARATGVHIIAATGYHRAKYYAPDAPQLRLTAEEAGDYFVGEIRGGLAEAREDDALIYPGFIKIAAEATVASSPIALMEGAAAACLATGYAIEMHTEQGAAIEHFLDFFIQQGVSPQRLVFCHVDKRPDLALHRDLAAAGVVLEYDTFFRPKYQPDKNVWPLIEAMVAAGGGRQIALATDLADSAMWRSYGGAPGMVAFVTQVEARLRAMSLPEGVIQGLMGANIAARLAVPVSLLEGGD
ncbi:MAG: hypothetical protein U0641_08415 [Anaerolineae bacterium]